METVREIAKGIIAREGGYVDDPDDPGGPTKYGVTLKTLKRLGIDTDGDGTTGADDLHHLTKAQAAELFIEHYYRRTLIEKLPQVLRASVFDMYVNAGANAVKILQRLLGEMGQQVAVDGVIGNKTIAAAMAAHAAGPAHLADAYGIARRNYYYRLGDARPASRKYARRRDGGKGGWIRRAESFISERYRLSDAEHQARVAAWD